MRSKDGTVWHPIFFGKLTTRLPPQIPPLPFSFTHTTTEEFIDLKQTGVDESKDNPTQPSIRQLSVTDTHDKDHLFLLQEEGSASRGDGGGLSDPNPSPRSLSKIREHWQIDGWLSEIVAVIVSLPAPSSFPPSLESTTTRWSRDYLGTSLLTLSFPSFRPYPNPAYYTLFALPWVRISGIGMMMLVTMIMATTDQTHKNKHCTERRRRRSAATRATIIVGGVA